MAISKNSIRDNKYIRLGLFVAFLAIVAMLFPRNKVSQYIYETGTSWVEPDVIAPFTFPIYKEKAVYEKEKQAARDKVLPVFRRQTASFDEKGFNSLVDTLGGMIEQDIRLTNPDRTIPNLLPNPALDKLNLSAKDKTILLSDYQTHSNDKSKTLISLFRTIIPKQISVTLSDGVINVPKKEIRSEKLVIRSENGREERVFDVRSFRDSTESLETIQELISEKLIGIPLSKAGSNDTLKIATKLITPFLEPNIIFDKRETDAAKLRAESAIPIADGLVRENEKIISRGEKITPITKRMLDSFLRAKAEREAVTGDLRIYLGKMIIVAIICAMFMIYVYLFREKIFQDNLMLALITLIILFELFITWYTFDLDQLSPYIIPIGLASVLFTILFDSRISTFATVTIALLAAVVRGNDFQFAVASIFAGGLGIFSTRDIRKRSQIAISVIFIFLGYALSIIGFSLSKLSPIRDILSDFLSAAISSLACFLVYPTLLLIEKVFGITTDLTLVELSDVNHPLLKDMALNAPGTYHHTMMVSMLSERAATDIGANQLLCRVGAYFHDIGKTPNSQFFTENQGKDNPHDRLDPLHSARIISGHVIDGLAIGRSKRIPQEVLNFIPEHHGTTVMHYFFDKEKNQETEDQIKEENFRYPGPKPQSKETAIVMLADGVEASVRSLSDPTEDSIRKIAETVVEKRLDEGQFSECPITFAEINMVKESFIKTLMAAYHKRIKYPGQKL